MAHIFVISAPSGAGKTTIVKKLLRMAPKLVMSVSYTTRCARPTEKEGIDYKFITKSDFDKMIAEKCFVEWAEVHGQLYGTTKADVEESLRKGLDVLLDIDTQGAEIVKKNFPEAVLIFILPPSFDELEKRLRLRGLNTEEDMEIRINNAKHEYSKRHEYDYQVVNEHLEEAVEEVFELIKYYRGEI